MTTSAYQIVPRGDVHPSPLNPRKAFDQAKLQELADSMADGKGIIEPLVVRSTGKANADGREQFELIAGERRWRASELAGLADVPIVVRSLKDHEVLELMLIENKQRADLGPLEEAESYKQLMSLTGYDVDEVAHKIGMSSKYVYDRVKLLQLVPEAKQLLLDGVITAGHAIIIARQKPDVQKRLLDHSEYGLWEDETADLFDSHEDRQKARKGNPYAGKKICTVRELQSWLDANVALDLKETGDLFPDLAESVARAARVASITLERHVPHDLKGKEVIYAAHDPYNSFGGRWRLADGTKGNPKCDHAAVGVVVIGPKRGTSLPAVCVSTNACEVHWPKPKAAKEAPPARRAAGSNSASASDESWKKKQAAQRQSWKLAQSAIQAAIVAGIKKAAAAKLAAIAMENFGHSSQEKVATKLIPGADAAAVLQRLALQQLLDDIEAAPTAPYYRKGLLKTAAGIGVKLEPILKAHEPKAETKAAPKKAAAKPAKKKGAAKR